MIYKNGKPSADFENYKIVGSKEQHDAQLKEWADIGPEKVEKSVKTRKDVEKPANSVKAEVKPAKKKKVVSKEKSS